MMTTIGLILRSVPTWLYASILLIGGALYYGHHERVGGEETIAAKWKEDTLAKDLAEEQAVNAAVAKALASNEVIRVKQEASHAKQVKDYEDYIALHMPKVAANRAAIVNAGGLRLPKTVCAAADGSAIARSTQAKNAGQGNGSSDDSFKLPSGIEEGLLNLATRADIEMTQLEAKLRMAQQFALDNGFAK